MSKKTKLRAKTLRVRPEVARLRAIGGLTSRVIVDGVSIGRWCERTGVVYRDVLQAVVAAAVVGDRSVILVTSQPHGLPPPHIVVASTASVAVLLRGNAFGHIDMPHLPSVVCADIERDRQLLDALEGGVRNVLDVATGRLWFGDQRERYDADHAAKQAAATPKTVDAGADALAEAIVSSATPRRQAHVVTAFHRDKDDVILDKVAIDDGVRRTAEGHTDCLALLRQLVASGAEPVMTSSLDVLDALYDASITLPAAVEDPALACVLLDPDTRAPPPGVGPFWRTLLGRRAAHAVRVPLDRALDELPRLQAELRATLAKESLLSVYDDDIQVTLPLLAALECEGFRVDETNLAQDVAWVESEMATAWNVIVSGPPARAFINLDLVRAPTEEVAGAIQSVDGGLPEGWRTNAPSLERLALFGNVRAKAVERLRGLDAVHGWMKRLEGRARLRSVLEPGSTGRWYAHGEALFTIPKHEPEAMLLRRHLVPEPGHVFVSGDFAAFEPRLLAHQSGDLVLAAGAGPGKDIYTHLVPLLGVTTRASAKAALLAFMYGQSPRTFAASLPLPSPEGHRIFAALATTLPKVIQFRTDVQEGATDAAVSMYGWRRLRGTASAAKFARRAFNLKMQGSGADLFRKLLRDLKAGLPADTRVVHQEFDAVVLTCPTAMASGVKATLKRTMEGVAQLSVRLVADTKHGATLADVS